MPTQRTTTRRTPSGRTPPAEPQPGSAPERDPAATDGRTLRAERTRTAIVDALLALLDEGDLQPPAARIAERAGISLRLIYHHFGDLESLFRAVASREAERMADLVEPVDADLPTAIKVERIVDQRARQLEAITPVRRASLLQEPFSEELRNARDAFYAIGRAQVLGIFAPEIDALPEDRRSSVRDALGVSLSWGIWNDLRLSGKTVDETKAATAAMVSSLLRS